MADLLRPAWRTRPIAPYASTILTLAPTPFPILSLPGELIISIATYLDTPTLTCLARATRWLYSFIQPTLYQRALIMTCPNVSTPFQWCPTGGRSILHFAAAHAQTPLLGALLARIGSRTHILNARDSYGHTALISAVLWGHEDVAQALLRAGADTEVRTKQFGWTAIHCAALTGHPRLVEILIRAGADREARDTLAGLTPLHLLVLGSNRRNSLNALLVKMGCRLDARDKDGVDVPGTMILLNQCELRLGKPRSSEVSQQRQQEDRTALLGLRIQWRRAKLLRYEMDRCRWCVKRKPWAPRQGSSHGWHNDSRLWSWDWDRRESWFTKSGCQEKLDSVNIAREISRRQGRM